MVLVEVVRVEAGASHPEEAAAIRAAVEAHHARGYRLQAMAERHEGAALGSRATSAFVLVFVKERLRSHPCPARA